MGKKTTQCHQRTNKCKRRTNGTNKKHRHSQKHHHIAGRCCRTGIKTGNGLNNGLENEETEAVACLQQFGIGDCDFLQSAIRVLLNNPENTQCVALLVDGVWIFGAFQRFCGSSIQLQARIALNGCPPLAAGTVGPCFNVFIPCCKIQGIAFPNAAGCTAPCQVATGCSVAAP